MAVREGLCAGEETIRNKDGKRGRQIAELFKIHRRTIYRLVSERRILAPGKNYQPALVFRNGIGILHVTKPTRCQYCRRSFGIKPTGRSPRFCSVRCRMASHRRCKREIARNDWHSPPQIVQAARIAMGGIELDPASSPEANRIVGAERFYSVVEDGLTQPWKGKVWLNPPNGQLAPKFVRRFAYFYAQGFITKGILLLGTHHLTTRWCRELLAWHPLGCLPALRLQFSGSVGRPAHGSVILALGISMEDFGREFRHLGTICCF